MTEVPTMIPIDLLKWEPEGGVMEKQGVLRGDVRELKQLNWPHIDPPTNLIVYNDKTRRSVRFQKRATSCYRYFSLSDEFLIEIIFE